MGNKRLRLSAANTSSVGRKSPDTKAIGANMKVVMSPKGQVESIIETVPAQVRYRDTLGDVECVDDIYTPQKAVFSRTTSPPITSVTTKTIKMLKFSDMHQFKSAPYLGNICVLVLRGCIKDFLRSLSEPLIPNALPRNFFIALLNTSEEDIARDLTHAVNGLPHPNQDILAFLILSFQGVDDTPEDLMENWAVVFTFL
uniref:Rho-GAP domain-containing protein n=1 Tax=Glossina austeni TaxID=7395 RepID=A0A1A9VDE9_GLOAU